MASTEKTDEFDFGLGEGTNDDAFDFGADGSGFDSPVKEGKTGSESILSNPS